jgi:hypothetical protein
MESMGLELFPRRQTDAEYIEAVRKDLGRSKWMALQHGAMAVLFICSYCAISWMSLRMAGFTERVSGASGNGAGVGIILGVMQGIALVFAIACIGLVINVVKGQRAERLLIRYYDQIRQQDSDCQQSHRP